ncbi:MAG: type I toxin-antitoxin system SymE family toxin [Lachnospiraceae bacterium]|nr:type I toxin-antitoxin system SymE family toxin [Lachnospiraceae bacterium]
MAFKKIRNMKVYNVRRYEDYKDTPTIIMKGEWLKEAGFDIGSLIQVECENGKLVITPRKEASYADDFGKQQIRMVAEKGAYR